MTWTPSQPHHFSLIKSTPLSDSEKSEAQIWTVLHYLMLFTHVPWSVS